MHENHPKCIDEIIPHIEAKMVSLSEPSKSKEEMKTYYQAKLQPGHSHYFHEQATKEVHSTIKILNNIIKQIMNKLTAHILQINIEEFERIQRDLINRDLHRVNDFKCQLFNAFDDLKPFLNTLDDK